MSTEPGRRRAARRGEVERERSWGGVAVRDDDVVVIRPRGKKIFALPKGGGDPGEEGPQTAAREVREETGITVEVGEELGDVVYWYRRSGRRIRKTVTFYLCRYVSGSTDDHDDEVEEARWMPLAEAAERLAFAGDREMVTRALTKRDANG